MSDSPRVWAEAPVLVTGGLGFIGSNLVLRLVGLGARVTILDSLAPDCGGNRFNVHDVADRVETVVGDACDRALVERLVTGKRVVFDLAGRVSHADSMRDPFADLSSNALGPLTVLEACRAHSPDATIVYASSRQIYGRPSRLPVDEDHPVAPVDVNGIHKAAAEGYHRLYHDVHGLKTVRLRLTNTYGPRQLVRHDRQGFIGWFVRTVVEGGEIRLFGGGGQMRDLNHVDDVVDALLRAGSNPRAAGRAYNLAGDAGVTLAELARLLVELAGKGSIRSVPFPANARRIDIGDYRGDATLIARELDWRPTVPLRDGLADMLCYVEANLEHYR